MRSQALLFIAMMGICQVASAEPNYEKLADAIGKAENSKNHPYGIMQKYKHTTPRQACINTCRHQYVAWSSSHRKNKGTYLEWLQRVYAPTMGATNDPRGLNRNWLVNVRYWLKAGNTKQNSSNTIGGSL